MLRAWVAIAVLLAAGGARAEGRWLGVGRLSYYCVADEKQQPGPPDTRLCSPRGKTIATVSRRLARQARLQGTALLADGRLLNVAGGSCPCPFRPCFIELDRARAPFGLGARGNALVPYRTVAVDTRRIPLGTRLYVPALDGFTAPDRDERHDGCVIAGDVGGGVDGLQLDFFVGACVRDHPARKLPYSTRILRDPARCQHLARSLLAPVRSPERAPADEGITPTAVSR